jgi:hypothetical protein
MLKYAALLLLTTQSFIDAADQDPTKQRYVNIMLWRNDPSAMVRKIPNYSLYIQPVPIENTDMTFIDLAQKFLDQLKPCLKSHSSHRCAIKDSIPANDPSFKKSQIKANIMTIIDPTNQDVVLHWVTDPDKKVSEYSHLITYNQEPKYATMIAHLYYLQTNF